MRGPGPWDLGHATDYTLRTQRTNTTVLTLLRTRSRRAARSRARGRGHAGGRARGLVRLEVRGLRQVILGHGKLQLVGLILGLVARDDLEGVRSQRYVLGA